MELIDDDIPATMKSAIDEIIKECETTSNEDINIFKDSFITGVMWCICSIVKSASDDIGMNRDIEDEECLKLLAENGRIEVAINKIRDIYKEFEEEFRE